MNTMIHAYKLAGTNIVVDAASGAVHKLDDLAFDAVIRYETHSPQELTAELLRLYAADPLVNQAAISKTLAEIDALKAAGQLFANDTYAPLAEIPREDPRPVKALCLHVAHCCNLICDYCFARATVNHGTDSLMSFETGRAALDFLLQNSGTRRNLEVDFFGGEPLLNWSVLQQLVAYGREQETTWSKRGMSKRFRFTLTTNGMLLDDAIIAFANEHMDNVVLSLDGRREIHDHFRKTSDGRGSFDIVLPKFRQLIATRTKGTHYIRGTFTRRNLDFVTDILALADLGFTELAMEPAVSCGAADEYSLQENDLPRLSAEYERLAFEMRAREQSGQQFRFYHYNLNPEHAPCVHKRLLGCGVGTEYLAVTPTGELYPCHQFVGDSDFCMGNVWRGVTTPDLQAGFAAVNIYTRPDCRDCWAKLYCSGGCTANGYHAAGTLHGVDKLGCELFKKRLECALWLLA